MTSLRIEIEQVAERFGVATTQVWRDHLVSYALAAISRTVGTEDVIFFGGTALSRTHLPDVRLSEDIDLIATGNRSDVAASIERSLRLLRRTHGAVTFDPPLPSTRGATPAVMRTDDGLTVQVQLLQYEDYPRWPTEVADIQQRYSDAPPAHLRVLTAPAFGAAKLSAWLDRRASRDLYDLYAMAARGLITPDSVDLFSRLGSFTRIPGWTWSSIPDTAQWRVELGHQLRLAIEPEEAANVARQAWAQAAH